MAIVHKHSKQKIYKIKLIGVAFFILGTFFLIGCSIDNKSILEREKIADAYAHLKKARECMETELPNVKPDHIAALREYEKAYAISGKEFWAEDYKNMSILYLDQNNIKKYIEFDKITNKAREEEEKTGVRGAGILFIKNHR